MREYIERQIENLRNEVDMHIRLYKGAIAGIRETVAKDISEEDAEKWTFLHPINPDDTHAKWVGVQYNDVCRRAGYLQEVQKRLLFMLELLSELDKYEAPSTVTLDDAARKIVEAYKQAIGTARRFTLKKDESKRIAHESRAEGHLQALKALGYTDEQIDEMLK